MAQHSTDAPPAHDATGLASATDASTHAAGTEAAHGEEHGSGGLPQFEFQWWAGQIFWLLLIFGVLYLLLSKIFLPRLRSVRDERTATIAAAIETARQVQEEAASQADAARAEVEKARIEARTTAAAAKARVNAESAARAAAQEASVNARIAEAEAGIRASRDKAMDSVASIAAETAQLLVGKVSGKPATTAEVSAALKESV